MITLKPFPNEVPKRYINDCRKLEKKLSRNGYKMSLEDIYIVWKEISSKQYTTNSMYYFDYETDKEILAKIKSYCNEL